MTEEIYFKNAIIDADSILYQIAHVQPSPALCKKALDDALKDIMTATEADNGLVFIKGTDNFRYHVAVDYKGNRKDTIEPEVKDRIEMLYEYAKDFCIESDHAEADDYCGVAAQLATNENESYVVCHIDKDLDMIPGWHYNFRKKEFYQVTPEEGYYNLMKQILTGDATDNIQGIKGMGPKTAEKVLKDVPLSFMLDTVIGTYKLKCGSTWEHDFHKSANLIYIRMNSDDFKPLTFEELKEKLSWKTTDTGTPYQTDQTTPSDLSTTSKTLKQEDDTLEESN
jgi:5'-3' exonuclease